MAEDKRPFLLYSDLIHVVKKLPTEKAGELFMVILEYVNDLDPQIDDMVLDLVFEPIRQSLKRDLVKYIATKEKRATAGRQGGIKSGETRSKPNQEQANEANASPPKQKKVAEKVEVIPNSPYGSGELHFKTIQWQKVNANKYEIELFKDFLTHWTAPVQKGANKGRELWKTKETFEIGPRLATWAKNEANWTKNEKQNSTNGNNEAYLNKTSRELEAIFDQPNGGSYATV